MTKINKILKIFFWISIIIGAIALINAASFYIITRFTDVVLPLYMNYFWFLIMGGALVVLPFLIWGIKLLVKWIIKKIKNRKKKSNGKKKSPRMNKIDKDKLSLLNVGILGGFISGATIWTYGYLIDIGYQVYIAVLISVAVFLILYLPIITQRKKN